MTVKIDQKIVHAEVVNKYIQPATAAVVAYERPSKLRGITYKIKPPTMSAALYITVNDLELPEGGKRPLEVFLASKDVSHTQWMHALTRMLSFILRQPTIQVHLAISELKQIIDPQGTYFLPKDDPAGRGSVGGIVAHVGRILEKHCESLGLIPKIEVDADRKQMLAEKRQQADASGASYSRCPKCREMTYTQLDGCWTCLSCGESKCQ